MKNILIIEDDQIVANIYRNKFSLEGYRVETAEDGETGLELIRTFQPHAVILDLMIPKLPGVDVIKKVRALPEFQHLPIIVFSNTYLTNTVQQAWKAGATKCLSKASCSPKHLLDIVRSTLAAADSDKQPSSARATTCHPAHPEPQPAATGSPAAAQPHPESPSSLRKNLLENLPATVGALRALLQSALKSSDETARLQHFADLRRRLHLLSGNAGISELHLVATMADAIEALVQELHDKPKNINPSTFRTLAGAIDCLGTVSGQSRSSGRYDLSHAKALVVDDEAISRHAVVSSLERAKIKAETAEHSEAALKLLGAGKYDLILLDIDMPGMTGYELCAKLRQLPPHAKTPVVFVTGLSGFEARANSMMSGGNDFIGKPFLPMELAVKALVHLVRAHPDKPHSTRPLQPAPTMPRNG